MKHSDVEFISHLNLFRRQYRLHEKMMSNPLDGVPLADVVLIFILFVIVSSSYVVQPGVRIRLPQSESLEGIPFTPLVLTISQEGMMFFNDERATMNGLEESFRRMAFERPGDILLIEADQAVENSTLVRICDIAVQAGIKEVALAARSPEQARRSARAHTPDEP